MSHDFNRLELAILEWLRLTYPNSELSLQATSARFVKRNWTGVGFFVYLEVSKELKPIDFKDFSGYWPIDGPHLKSDDIDKNGGATLIWGEGGYMDCIEMYAHSGVFNEQVNNFELTS